MEKEDHIVAAIVMKAQSGDKKAMANLYEMFSQAMFNICLRLSDSREDAQDLLQESFCIAYSKLTHLKKAESFGGWLKQITIHECGKLFRENNRYYFIKQNIETEIPDKIYEEEKIWKIEIEKVRIEIENLPSGYRQVFVLFALENCSHRFIAQTLGISESTSRSQYHKAKLQLIKRLSKYF